MIPIIFKFLNIQIVPPHVHSQLYCKSTGVPFHYLSNRLRIWQYDRIVCAKLNHICKVGLSIKRLQYFVNTLFINILKHNF
ncbi:hypothetical protein D3C81_1690280 [compost metagenome]